MGYALLQVGFGFPQSFFWKGEDTPHAHKMNQLIGKYFSREVTRDSYGSSETKPYRYDPVEQTIQKDKQAVYPLHAMEQVIEGATSFAVAHCPCRVSMRLRDRPCEHPEEVCLKFDEMAEYAIERELARRITRDEAREIIRLSAREGLVHFVDNAGSGVKHNCNCCGCACWNVGTIRRRKVPRDTLMAAYFLRETDPDRCTGCGDCVEICPVQAVTVEDGRVTVDLEWCIGCGVCATRCGFDACAMIHREDRGEVPGEFGELHRDILREKGTEPG